MSKKIWGGKKISEIIQDAEQKKIKLNEFFTESRQVVDKINSAAAEVNKNLGEISNQAEHVKNIVSNINETQSSIQQIKDEVENLKEATNKLIETNKTLMEEIKNQLGIAAGGSLSHTFNDRKTVLEWSTKNGFGV